MAVSFVRNLWHSRNDDTDRRGREWLLRRLPKRAVGLEIGVHLGEFSQLLLDELHPQRLHLIDPWIYSGEDIYRRSLYGSRGAEGQAEMDRRYESVRERFQHEIEQDIVVVHRATSANCVDEFVDGYFDWIYVDANHLYDYVRQDLELYAPKVKENGFIAGDDYGISGWWENGVTRAVDAFVAEGRAQRVGVRHRQFLLQKR